MAMFHPLQNYSYHFDVYFLTDIDYPFSLEEYFPALDFTVLDRRGCTLLMAAAYDLRFCLLDHIFKKYAPPMEALTLVSRDQGYSLLDHLVMGIALYRNKSHFINLQFYRIARLFMESGVDPNQSSEQYDPLFYASEKVAVQAALVLIRAGAVSKKKESPFIQKLRIHVAEVAVKKGIGSLFLSSKSVGSPLFELPKELFRKIFDLMIDRERPKKSYCYRKHKNCDE